jgi:pimeloyl-ACP methyl ester carboxylesterase
MDFAGLVLTGAPLVRLSPTRRPSASYRVIRWLNRRGVVSDQRLESERRKRGSADYRAATGIMRDILVKMIGESYETEMETITAPVTLIWGESDLEVPVEVARQSMLHLGSSLRAELEVVPGGHHLPLEAPERLREAIESMLR